MMAFQKEEQRRPACSEHCTASARNKFRSCACATLSFQVCPTKIMPRNVLFADIAHRGIGLVTYPSLSRSSSIDNLASWVKWHVCMLPKVDCRTCQDCTLFRSCSQRASGRRVWYNSTGGRVYEPRTGTASAGETR